MVSLVTNGGCGAVRYKSPDGKPLNSFGFGEEPLDVAEALEVIEETHGYWRRLREKGHDSLWVG